VNSAFSVTGRADHGLMTLIDRGKIKVTEVG